jgi:hypothetical protein
VTHLATPLSIRPGGQASPAKWGLLLALGAVLWYALYRQLVPFSEWTTAQLGAARQSAPTVCMRQ